MQCNNAILREHSRVGSAVHFQSGNHKRTKEGGCLVNSSAQRNRPRRAL